MRNPRNTSVALPSSELHTGVTPASESDSINHNQQTSATTTALPQHTSEDHLTIVIKLGSSSIVNEDDFQPQLALLSSIVETVCNLRRKGHRVVLVSSGAIAMGLKRMEMRNKPKILAEKQALAAIGQGRLIALWDNLFAMLGQPIAQVLLTRSDISDRSRYLNSTKTLSALLSYGVIPIVNENDTVSVSEIKFGDNDTLSAITASMVQANYLFLLTDVDCLYTDNPRRFPELAKPVKIVRDIEKLRSLVSTSTMGSNLGTGGMETKIIAAELATNAGIATVITHGRKPENILAILGVDPPSTTFVGVLDQDEEYENNTPLHTLFLPEPNPLSDKRWWVVHGLKPRGKIIIDEGAYRAIARSTVNAVPSSSSSSNTPVPSANTPPLSSTSSSTPLTPQSAQASSSSTIPESAVPSPSLLATSSARPLASQRSNSRSTSSSSSGNGGRLLPAGVVAVEGTFAAGQAVTIVVQRKRRKSPSSEIAALGTYASTSSSVFSANGNSIPHPPEAAAAAIGNSKSRKNSANRSGNSSLANSLILEQAKQIGEPYDTSLASAGTPESNHPSSPTKSQSKSTRKGRNRIPKEGYSTTGDTTDIAETTTDDEGMIEVIERIEFGRGLANYNYQEIDRIKGHKSSEIERILGYIESEHCVESITSLKRLEL